MCNYTRVAGMRQGAARVVLLVRPAELGASQGRRRRDSVLALSSSSSGPLGADAASGVREPQLVSIDGRAGPEGAATSAAVPGVGSSVGTGGVPGTTGWA